MRRTVWRSLWKLGIVIILLTILIKLKNEPPCMIDIINFLRIYPKHDGDPRQPSDVTVVTGYFNLGNFRKGKPGNVFSPKLYTQWASVFKFMHNPVVLYTDSLEFSKTFSEIRSSFTNLTKIVLIQRQRIWAFNYVNSIKEIYSNPDYPKYHPNTVMPEYTCAQHAKYSCMEMAIEHDFFNTKYFMWIDVGYFRNILDRKKKFRLVRPAGFEEEKIAFTEVVSGYTMNESVEEIFKKMLVWIGGGLFFGRQTQLRLFLKDYRKAVERYLALSLSNSDQQVLFSMFTNVERPVLIPSVEVQTFKWFFRGPCWFYLGYKCYREL